MELISKQSVCTSVQISKNIKVLKEAAFANNALSSITIPSKVTTISSGAFFNNKLTKLTVPANVQSLEFSSLLMNPLKTITLKGKKTTIIKSANISKASANYQFGINTTPLNNLFTTSKYTKAFAKWNQPQTTPTTLYVRWK